jgi:hypothetical protein
MDTVKTWTVRGAVLSLNGIDYDLGPKALEIGLALERAAVGYAVPAPGSSEAKDLDKALYYMARLDAR